MYYDTVKTVDYITDLHMEKRPYIKECEHTHSLRRLSIIKEREIIIYILIHKSKSGIN